MGPPILRSMVKNESRTVVLSAIHQPSFSQHPIRQSFLHPWLISCVARNQLISSTATGCHGDGQRPSAEMLGRAGFVGGHVQRHDKGAW